MRRKEAIIVPKVWRSELRGLVIFFLLCAASILLSKEFPGSIIKGELFRMGTTRMMLHLPLFWFLPAVSLGKTLWKMYNVCYLMDAAGIEARHGILSLHQTIARIRYIDIRSAEIQQTLTDRILSVGDVIISSAARQAIDCRFEGVAVPQEVKEVILAERDKRQRLEGQPGEDRRGRARA